MLYITGFPGKVPIVNVANSTDGDVVNFILTWGEPFNNYDPIIIYHVSCSGDAPCPQSYNTTNNHTRSHTFTGFTPNSYYTFSVVAVNSIGSGEDGVVMVGEIITTTIAPSVVSMNTIATTATITPSISEDITTAMSSENMITTTSSEDMTTTSTMATILTDMTLPSGSLMTTINSTVTTPIISASMVEVVTTVTSSNGNVSNAIAAATAATTPSSRCIMHV